MPGDEKRYSLVLVLDRSGSMDNGSPRKIETATAAIARFALAAEELEIEVAVIDFYRGEARLVKPFSVDVEHAQAALMADQAGGGTPLSDALALARNLIQSRSEEPLIVTITDDKPDRVDAVSEEIKGTYAPVCSLTIATDCRRGSPPAKAERLEQKYDRTATVFNPERLDDRLDQFASLLGGY
jgi:Mg-chelatase subunit ChlD